MSFFCFNAVGGEGFFEMFACCRYPSPYITLAADGRKRPRVQKGGRHGRTRGKKRIEGTPLALQSSTRGVQLSSLLKMFCGGKLFLAVLFLYTVAGCTIKLPSYEEVIRDPALIDRSGSPWISAAAAAAAALKTTPAAWQILKLPTSCGGNFPALAEKIKKRWRTKMKERMRSRTLRTAKEDEEK